MSDVKVCYICRFLWCVFIIATFSYAVFWLHQSGWWFALGALLASGDCESYRTPEQMAADINLREAKARIKAAEAEND